jgi:hypothetical protein
VYVNIQPEANASNTKVDDAGLKSGMVGEVSTFTIKCVKGGVGDKLKSELVPEGFDCFLSPSLSLSLSLSLSNSSMNKVNECF